MKKDNLKVVALLPFKNEEKFLPSYCSGVLPIIDTLVAIDDSSTDNSGKILQEECAKANVKLVLDHNKQEDVYYVDRIRKNLLTLGREEKASHFICIDADETFTANFALNARKIMERLEPGHKLCMQWLALWKSVNHYKNDNTVWSNNYKDFIFAEDNKSETHKTFIHENRTPGVNNEENNVKLNPKYGAVLHFQFSDWQNFQIKQAWYRCREFVSNPSLVGQINEKYRITLDDPNSIVSALPDSWKAGIVNPEISFNNNLENDWRLKKIKELFGAHGSEHFKDLEIWHVPEIRALS